MGSHSEFRMSLAVSAILLFECHGAAMAQPTHDPTAPEQQGSTYRLYTVRLNAAYPLPTAMRRGSAAERAGLAAYLQMQTGLVLVNIVDGQAYLQGDIHVGSEGEILVRNYLSSRFGAIIDRDDLITLLGD